jgi:hypothetical protein
MDVSFAAGAGPVLGRHAAAGLRYRSGRAGALGSRVRRGEARGASPSAGRGVGAAPVGVVVVSMTCGYRTHAVSNGDIAVQQAAGASDR